jgi:hypothetical protein
MSNAIYFTRYTNEVEWAINNWNGCLFFVDFGLLIRLIIWLKNFFESGLQYVYHNLQQKIQIENLSTTNVTEQNSLIKANNLLFLQLKTKITG